jgi:hypothetical protein
MSSAKDTVGTNARAAMRNSEETSRSRMLMGGSSESGTALHASWQQVARLCVVSRRNVR